MKSKEEIEKVADSLYLQKAEAIANIDIKGYIVSATKGGFMDGYTQCQEDMKPLLEDLFSLWETLAKCGEISVGLDFTKHYERLKQQLNKQD